MKELAKDTKSHLEGIFQTPKVEKGHLTEKQPQSRTMSKHTWTLGVTLKLSAKWREPRNQAMVSRVWGQFYVIRLQCQSQSLLNAMVLASLTTFHTPTIDGIRVWQEYNTGEARFIKCNEFNLPRKISTSQIMKVTEDNTSPKATFTKMKARGPAAEHLNRKSRAEKANSSPQETKLFQCPNYGYVKSFQRFSSPQR